MSDQGLVDLPTEIRPLPLPGLIRRSTDVLAAVPDDVNVLVAAAADQDGAGFFAYGRIGKKLSCLGRLEKKWDGRFEYGFEVIWFPGRKQ